MKKKGLLLVISGPSGAGKGTVCSEYVKRRPDCALSVSATTRAPREGEKEGESYFFLTKEEFKKRLSEDGFLEHAQFCGNFYGTPRAAVMEMIEGGTDVILEIEVQGAMQVRSHYPEAVLIFVLPPSRKRLEERLRGRNTEEDDVIKTRLARAEKELCFIEKYNYVLVNDNLSETVDELQAVITAEKCRLPRMYEFVNEQFLK